MSKIWLIIQREYLTRVRKKSFIISTLLAPLSIVFLIGIQIWMIGMGGTGEKNILVKDESGWFTTEIREGKFRPRWSNTESIKFTVSHETLEQLQAELPESGFDAILHIPNKSLERLEDVPFYSNEKLGMAARSLIESKLSEELRKIKMKEKGIGEDVLKDLRAKISLDERNAEGEESSSIIASALGFMMGFLMYMVLIIYGTMVMKGVSEEKTTRIVEVILSSVKPFQLMIGKIVGIGLVGLTQFVIWIFSMGIIYFVMGLIMATYFDPSSLEAAASAGQSMDVEAMQMKMQQLIQQIESLPLVWLAFGFIFYFLGGYLLYSSLYAAVGSAVGEDSSDNQSLAFPIMVPIIISIVGLSVVIENPDGAFAFWMSVIPFTSPVIMPARMAYGLSPFSLDFILSAVLLIGTFLLSTWFAAKIYRVGILMRGKKASVKELIKWLKY